MVLNFGHFRVLIKRFLYKNRVYAYQINEYSSVYLIEFIDNNLSGSFLFSAHIYAEMNSHKSTFFQGYLSSKTEDIAEIIALFAHLIWFSSFVNLKKKLLSQ